MAPNPKIQELIVSMGIIPESEHYDIAELIIRECIAQCDDENSQQYIMSHFDMKESDWS